jgi:hypothetical protein
METLHDNLLTVEPPAVTLEKCPGLLDWANSNEDESYAPILSLRHWRCKDASEKVPSLNTYNHKRKLNQAQLEAVKSAIRHRFSLILGVSSRWYYCRQITCIH